MTKKEKLATIHDEALREFNQIQSIMREERLMCLQDRRFAFLAGSQWEGPLGEQFENKPRPEMNKVALAVTRIYSEYRNNRIDVNFVSKDNEDDNHLAEVCAGLYRADEQDSQAEEAYDNAFEEAVAGGFGAWRLRTEYEDDEDMENENQRIRIEPIFDADGAVFFDMNSKRQDKSDARYCYVITAMTPEAYKEEFDREPTSITKTITQRYFDWFSPNVVYVAEYYKLEEKIEVIHIFEGIMGEIERIKETELNEDKIQELQSRGFKEIRTRKIKAKKCHKYIMDGNTIIEDCGYIAGNCIPIVPMYGKRIYVDNVERCFGHVRMAKDAQRVKNMQLGQLMEISAKSSYRKPIFTPEQITGHEYLWSEDNVKNYPYLLVNPITDSNGNMSAGGPVGYLEPPTVPPALGALIQLADADMNDILGNQQAGEQVVSAMSGKAVELIQNRLDMQSFIYVSNMAKAIKRSGEIWLSMAKDVFVEEGRKMKVIGDQDETDFVQIMTPKAGENGELDYENDLSKAKFDIAVDVGPSSSSKRASTVRALTGMMTITQDPQTQQVLGAAAMMNMEGEGLSDVRQYYRKQLIKMGVVKPTQKEQEEIMQEMQGQQPDAQSIYLQAAAQEAQAKAVKAQADTEKVKADTAKILTNLDREGREHVVEMAKQLNELTAPKE